jgi:ubiquinone/menaquinone biosynthesis C-methylase UbiE
MKWYDVFSGFYDNSLEKLYFNSRKRAIELLDVQAEQTILDIACGTGANFGHILHLNQNVLIYGTDYSEGMLRRAQYLIEKNKWKYIELFKADARDLTQQLVAKETHNNVSSFDRIICVLGLSVIPDWEKVLDSLIEILNEDGKIVIMDVYAEKRNFNTWLVETIAKADLNRKIWQTLETKTTNFYMEYLPVKENKVGGKLFVCVGTKKQI